MPIQTTLPAESRQDKRGLWRIGRQDIEDYIAEAYRRTAQRIAAGELEEADTDSEPEETSEHRPATRR